MTVRHLRGDRFAIDVRGHTITVDQPTGSGAERHRSARLGGSRARHAIIRVLIGGAAGLALAYESAICSAAQLAADPTQTPKAVPVRGCLSGVLCLVLCETGPSVDAGALVAIPHRVQSVTLRVTVPPRLPRQRLCLIGSSWKGRARDTSAVHRGGYRSDRPRKGSRESVMMGWDGNSGWANGGMVFMGIFLVALIALGVWAVLRSRGPDGPVHGGGETSRQILDRRFAAGEIDDKQYAESRRILEGRSLDEARR